MTANIVPAELTFEEMLGARQMFNTVTDEYLRTPHQLRQVLSKLSMFPPDDQIQVMMDHFEKKVPFTAFCKLLMFLKGIFKLPEAKDADTLRAFVALDGNSDRTGNIEAQKLRGYCKKFGLTIDIDKLILEVDTSRNGQIDFDEFTQLWRMGVNSTTSFKLSDTDTNMDFWTDAVRNAHLNLADEDDEENTSPSSRERLLSFPDAIRAVQVGVVLSGAAVDDDEEEMPRAEQLQLFLELEEHDEVEDRFAADDINFAALGQKGSAHNLFGASQMGTSMMNVGGGRSSIGGGGRRGSLQAAVAASSFIRRSSFSHKASEGTTGQTGGDTGGGGLMTQSSRAAYTTGSTTTGAGGTTGTSTTGDRAMSQFETPSVEEDATPAEVLKAAQELIEHQLKKFDHKKSEEEMDKRLDQMSHNRPPVVGGIGISERRGEGIELPDPLTIGGTRKETHYHSPVSARSGAGSSINSSRVGKRGWK